MDTLETITRSILNLLLAACMALLCVRLCTGCTIIRQLGQKANVTECLKTAYAEGGATAVSNKIESLVVSGDLSRKQADRLHVVAQAAYDKLLEHVETELSRGEACAGATASTDK